MRHTLLVTGAAGYVGAMLVKKFAERPDVERIIALDKQAAPELLTDVQKLDYLRINTADSWEAEAQRFSPNIIIHAAWDIRAVYGHAESTWRDNIDGSDRVFDYAFAHPSVARLIHFSTVASYGSYRTNTARHRFTEDQPLRPSDYLYAEEKRIAEERLEVKYRTRSNKDIAVTVVRPASITGPRGRSMSMRFGLQSALSGRLSGAFIYRVVKALVAFVPITPKWARQFVHEDDVVGIVERLAFGDRAGDYEVFNVCPPGPVVRGRDMARAVGKPVLPVAPWMVRFAFFVFWHLSRGKVPTAPGVWKGYSYPIVVNGDKVTTKLGYSYRYTGYEAFLYTSGAYEDSVAPALRSDKPKRPVVG